jgi:hypothetical protein
VETVEESFFADDEDFQPVTKVDVFLNDVFENNENFKWSQNNNQGTDQQMWSQDPLQL